MSEPQVAEITTPRLLLEPLRVDQAAEMAAVLQDQRLYRFIGGAPPNVSQLTEQYRRQVVGRSEDGAQRWLNWIVRVTDTAAAIGYVQATLVQESQRTVADIAWVIGADQQGRGYAVEAAGAMAGWLRSQGVNRLVAFVHPGHHASMAVARRLGLAPTGEVVDGEIRWSGG